MKIRNWTPIFNKKWRTFRDIGMKRFKIIKQNVNKWKMSQQNIIKHNQKNMVKSWNRKFLKNQKILLN